jgi:hypothetical protein
MAGEAPPLCDGLQGASSVALPVAAQVKGVRSEWRQTAPVVSEVLQVMK